jgi:hypothetical protein
MGDDRPRVYRDDNLWVYRASSLGGCERALLAARREEPASPPPPTLQTAFDQGHAAEDLIMRRWQDNHTWALVTSENSRQVQVQIVDPDLGAAIRGSLDGYAHHGEHNLAYPVDAKAFGKTLWDKLDKQGIWAFPHYCAQLAVYAAGLGVLGWDVNEAMLAVALKNDDGTVTADSPVRYVSVDIAELNERGYGLDGLWRKVERIETAARDNTPFTEFPCPREGGEWGCPYPQVEDRLEPVELTGDELNEFRRAVDTIEQIRGDEKALKALKATATDHLKLLVEKHGKRLKGSGKRVTWVRTERPERTVTYKASVSEYPKISDDTDDTIDTTDNPFGTG